MSILDFRTKAVDQYIADRNSSAPVEKMIKYFSDNGHINAPDNVLYGSNQTKNFIDYYVTDYPPPHISPFVSPKTFEANGSISLSLTFVGFGYNVAFEFENDSHLFKNVKITNKSWFS